MKKVGFLFTVMFLVIGIYAGEQEDFPALKGPYLGQKPPGMTAQLFSPGIFFSGNGFLSNGMVLAVCCFTQIRLNLKTSEERPCYRLKRILAPPLEFAKPNPNFDGVSEDLVISRFLF